MQPSDGALVKCFLEHQIIKPLAVLLGIAFVVIVGWVGFGHMQSVDSRVAGLAGNGRPVLGIEVVQPDELVARMFSFPPGEAMFVNYVRRDSPAHRAGIKRGDGIIAINGGSIRSPGDFDVMLSRIKKGDLLRLTVVRGGLVHNLLVTWGEQPVG